MNPNIALSVNPVKIPDPLEGFQKTLTLQHLMGQNELQQKQIAQLGQPKQMDPKDRFQLQAQFAAGILSAPPEARQSVYTPAVEEAIRMGIFDENTPRQYNPSFEANLKRLAGMGLSADQAMTRNDYATGGNTQTSQTYNALTGQPQQDQPHTNDAVRAAGIMSQGDPEEMGDILARSSAYTQLAQQGRPQQQLQGGPIAENATVQSDALQVDGVGSIFEKRRQAKEYRAQADNARRNGAVGLVASLLDQAKTLESEANQIEGRDLESRRINQAEQSHAENIRVREEGIALRKQNQSNQGTQTTLKLADDFRQEIPVQQYRKVMPIITTARAAVKRNTAGADVNLIYAVSKIFDPDSVVRDQERATVVNAGGLPAFVQSALGYVIGGQRIPDDIRKQLLQELESRNYAYEQAHNETAKVYTDQAKRWQLNPADIVKEYKIAPEPEVKSIVIGTPGPRRPESGNPAPKTIKWDDLK